MNCGLLNVRKELNKRQKERALTSPKTNALAFISVLPWRINDGQILTASDRM
jgi:hypothetical protein